MNKAVTKKDHGILRKIWFFIKFLEIRLRFVLILIVTALVVGYWDYIQNYYERWQRNRMSGDTIAQDAKAHEAEAQNEYEFFCPMHPFVIRNHKDKCPICGMDLVQRKKGASMQLPEGVLARVQVSPDRVMQAGVQIEPVGYRLLMRNVRTYGLIEPDESRVAKIIARFPGRIDKLMVNTLGANVKQGEPLAQIYSPKYLAASQEYIQALEAERRVKADKQASADERQRAQEMTSYAGQRLLLAGFTEEQLDSIKANPKIQNTVTLYSPLSGTVLEKNALLGESMEENSSLYTIADLSRVWVQAMTIESDLSAVKEGMAVEITTVAEPNRIFYGTVDFIYPTVNLENRSVKVRVAIDNPDGRLKPGMYVTAVMRSPVGRSGPAGSFEDDSMPQDSISFPQTKEQKLEIKLPTEKQEDADRYLQSLAPGAEYYQCPMELEVVSDKAGDCPKCGMHLEKRQKEAATNQDDGHLGHENKVATNTGSPAAISGIAAMANQPSNERWAVGYSCPMHPDELNDKPGVCSICGCGMKTNKIQIERVLSIPESAVIDTGIRQVVYVQSAPGVYDSRAVELGPRAGAFYPVLSGIKQGDSVVTHGSFLIDAEARLNPAASAASSDGEPAGHQHGN